MESPWGCLYSAVVHLSSKREMFTLRAMKEQAAAKSSEGAKGKPPASCDNGALTDNGNEFGSGWLEAEMTRLLEEDGELPGLATDQSPSEMIGNLLLHEGDGGHSHDLDQERRELCEDLVAKFEDRLLQTAEKKGALPSDGDLATQAESAAMESEQAGLARMDASGACDEAALQYAMGNEKPMISSCAQPVHINAEEMREVFSRWQVGANKGLAILRARADAMRSKPLGFQGNLSLVVVREQRDPGIPIFNPGALKQPVLCTSTGQGRFSVVVTC